MCELKKKCNLKILRDHFEHHENQIIIFENNENHENLRNQCENFKYHENVRIPHENQENHKKNSEFHIKF